MRRDVGGLRVRIAASAAASATVQPNEPTTTAAVDEPTTEGWSGRDIVHLVVSTDTPGKAATSGPRPGRTQRRRAVPTTPDRETMPDRGGSRMPRNRPRSRPAAVAGRIRVM